MSVEILDWPAEDGRRQALAQRGVPRLLVVSPDVPPPIVTDHFEDWIRRPHTTADLEARLTGLQARSVEPATDEDSPAIDDDGVLRTERGWIALSEVEVKLMSELVGRYRTVVDRDSLQNAAWPNQQVSRNLLDVYLHKLRPRVIAVGLEINTVRKRGYLLDRIDVNETVNGHQQPGLGTVSTNSGPQIRALRNS